MTRLLGLDFKSDSTVKLKGMKRIVKRIAQLYITLSDFNSYEKQYKCIASVVKKYCQQNIKRQKNYTK